MSDSRDTLFSKEKTGPHGAVVLLSGGLDSSVLLHYVCKRLGVPRVHALSFDYGQRHARELACAQEQAQLAGARHVVVDLTFLGDLLGEASALLEGGAAVPALSELTEEQRAQPPTYVPNRNMTLLAIAAGYAEAVGAYDVFYGAQAQDRYGYWDCTLEFVERLNAALALNRRTPVRIHAPFVGYSKAEMVALGLELGVDFARTWSCYRGEELPCGVCPTCVERTQAFAALGIEDPLYTSRTGVSGKGL